MARPGEYAGKVIGARTLVEMLAPFGMLVQLDREADQDFQVAQLANALVGVAEAHASRAEDAYRKKGAAPEDLVQASLMAFGGAACDGPGDDLALIQWRAQHLAGALHSLDFPGPFPREGQVGSGDALIKTMRLTAAALLAMAHAALVVKDPERGDGEAGQAGVLLNRAMDALEKAAGDAPAHRAVGDLLRMTPDM